MNNRFAKRAYVDHFVCIKRIYCRQGYFSPRGFFFRHICTTLANGFVPSSEFANTQMCVHDRYSF